MPNVQCPGCGTIVAVDPAAGQIMGCPNCRTLLSVGEAPTAQSAVQGRTGEMPIPAPPPPGSPAASPRAGEMPVASPPPPGTTTPPASQIPSPAAADQITVQAAVQAAAQAAATQAVAAHVAAHVAAQNAAQAAPQQAAPVATPVGRAAPAALAAPEATAVPQTGTQVTSSRRVVRRKSTQSAAGLYTVFIVAGVGFVVLGGALILYLNGGSKTRVTSSPTKSSSKPANGPAKSDQPAAGGNTAAPAAAAKIQVQVQSVEFDAPRGRDAAGMAMVLEERCLVVQLKITNTGDAAARYESWYLRPYTAVGGNSPEETRLVDDRSRVYPAATFPGAVTFRGHTPKARIAAGESVVDALLFRVPAGFSPRNIKSLRLTLSGKAVGQKSGFRLKIDGSKIVEL